MVQKYLAALLHIAIVLSGALVAVIDKPITLTVAAQLGVLAAGSIANFYVPLMKSSWQAWGKVVFGGAIPAVLTAAIPYLPGLSGHLTAQNLIPVFAAVIAALGAVLGVSARTDAHPEAVVGLPDPAPFTPVIGDVSGSTSVPAPADPDQPAAGTPPATA